MVLPRKLDFVGAKAVAPPSTIRKAKSYQRRNTSTNVPVVPSSDPDSNAANASSTQRSTELVTRKGRESKAQTYAPVTTVLLPTIPTSSVRTTGVGLARPSARTTALTLTQSGAKPGGQLGSKHLRSMTPPFALRETVRCIGLIQCFARAAWCCLRASNRGRWDVVEQRHREVKRQVLDSLRLDAARAVVVRYARVQVSRRLLHLRFREIHLAALRLQKLWRGYSIRCAYQRTRQMLAKAHERDCIRDGEAATRIQAHVRRRSARARYQRERRNLSRFCDVRVDEELIDDHIRHVEGGWVHQVLFCSDQKNEFILPYPEGGGLDHPPFPSNSRKVGSGKESIQHRVSASELTSSESHATNTQEKSYTWDASMIGVYMQAHLRMLQSYRLSFYRNGLKEIDAFFYLHTQRRSEALPH